MSNYSIFESSNIVQANLTICAGPDPAETSALEIPDLCSKLARTGVNTPETVVPNSAFPDTPSSMFLNGAETVACLQSSWLGL